MARPAPPSEDGSPARLIATMVGIVGILLLGSLAWSAVGALVSAVGSAGQVLTSARVPATLAPAVAVAVTVTVTPATLVVVDVATPTVPPPTAVAAAEPTRTEVLATPTPEATKRNPWVLLPQPEPNAHVSPGPVTIEARGRGDAPITAIHLDLDGASLPIALEQRSESTWRGFAKAQVSAGQHAVRATVTDAEGRTGSFRWSFAAGP